MIEISVLIPTIGNRINELERLLESILSQKEVIVEVVVVSQNNHTLVEKSLLKFGDTLYIKHIKQNRKGLSVARNEGLKHVSGKYVTFSDDDCWYVKNIFKTIMNDFKLNHQLAGATYQIYDPTTNQYYKNYSSEGKNELSKKDIYRKSSIEGFYDVQYINKHQIKFDENFGLGAKYNSGEENIFLSDMLKTGAQIAYYPYKVVYHLKPTQESRINDDNFAGKGPLFKRMHGSSIGMILTAALWWKKRKMLKTPYKTLIKTLQTAKKYTIT
jgi:glycosyltransferase involved in cell wall biosynthesis